MPELSGELDRLAAETGFSGAVRIDRGDQVELAAAYGLAHRGWAIANTTATRFAIASGSKGLTALAVMALVADGVLDLATTARSLLGADLPLIDDGVTVEHLLGHRSGIGDYLDEDDERPISDYVLARPVHELAATEAFVPLLDGHPAKFAPGERFSYCNGGYVVLALLAERASGVPFHELVERRVCAPAGMVDTGFPRSDEPAGGGALGYLDGDGPRTNLFHLPVRGNGDGGASSTLADLRAFWLALFAGRIVPAELVELMVAPRSSTDTGSMRYGLGFWLEPSGGVVELEGYDAGVSFRSNHDPAGGRTVTVMSNTSEGAWPVARFLAERLA